MKKNRILSTAGLSPSTSTRLKSYCNLMQISLSDKWLFADEFIESHVCFVSGDYLVNWDQETLNKSQIIVVIDKSGYNDLNYDYHLKSPITGSKIKDVLNEISKSTVFKTLNPANKESTIHISKFKSAFTKFRNNLFRKKNKNLIEIKRNSKNLFISRLTQKIKLNELPTYNIVLLGSPASGKTTAIQSVSSGNALNSDVSATDSVACEKAKTTVGIDYAEIIISGYEKNNYRKLKLFGTPGQIKFNFIWDMVGKSADAFIILLDMSRPEPLSYLKFYLKFLKTEISHVSQIYCTLTHCDKYSGDISTFIDDIDHEFPILSGLYRIDARIKDDVRIMVEDIYPQIEKEYSKKPPLQTMAKSTY